MCSYSYSFHWLFSVITLINFDVIKSSSPANGIAGYCSLDQVKYGGSTTCSSGPAINYSPAPQEKDFADYAEIIGSVASVVAPSGGPKAVIFVNLFNNIGVKYGLSALGDDADGGDLENLIDDIDAKIDFEIEQLAECLTDFVFMQDNLEDINTITDAMEDIMGFSNEHTKNNLETRWDNVISAQNGGIIDHGEEEFTDPDEMNDLALPVRARYFELRLPVFEYYNTLFGDEIKSYFIAKYRLCNDPNRTNPTSAIDCRDKYNSNLNDARELIENMNIWLINALSIIRQEIYTFPILSKGFDSYPFSVRRVDRSNPIQPGPDHKISRIYFGQDHYGEGDTEIFDRVSATHVDVFIRMNNGDDNDNDDRNKYCQLPERILFCTTYFTDGFARPRLEHLTSECQDRLIEAATNKREEFRNEVDQCWYNLIIKYLSPMQQRIESLYTIPHLDIFTGMEVLIPREDRKKATVHSSIYTLTNEGRIRFERGSGCLTLDVGNNNARFSPCNGQSNQIWHLRDIDNNGYALIISKYNNRCLDVNYGGEGEDNIYATGCNANTPDQRWKITSNSIINGAERVGYQNCLDGHREASDDNARAVRCNEDDQNQQIIFRQESIIKATVTNECVRVESGDGGNVIRGDCNGDINERWELRQIGNDDFYALISLFNNKCLHVSGNRGDNEVNRGDRVISDVCKYGVNQLWKINGNMLISKGEYCLDVNHGQAIDVIVWGCDENNDNQMVVLPGFSSSVSN